MNQERKVEMGTTESQKQTMSALDQEKTREEIKQERLRELRRIQALVE